MVKELKTMNNKDFCKKYNISSPTVRKKKIELFSKQEKKETLKELNASKNILAEGLRIRQAV